VALAATAATRQAVFMQIKMVPAAVYSFNEEKMKWV
jgi:hypothetical protein